MNYLNTLNELVALEDSKNLARSVFDKIKYKDKLRLTIAMEEQNIPLFFLHHENSGMRESHWFASNMILEAKIILAKYNNETSSIKLDKLDDFKCLLNRIYNQDNFLEVFEDSRRAEIIDAMHEINFKNTTDLLVDILTSNDSNAKEIIKTKADYAWDYFCMTGERTKFWIRILSWAYGNPIDKTDVIPMELLDIYKEELLTSKSNSVFNMIAKTVKAIFIK